MRDDILPAANSSTRINRVAAAIAGWRGWPDVGRSFAWLALAVLGAGALWYTWTADLRDWLEHIGGLLSPLAIIWGVQRFLAATHKRLEEDRKSRHYRAWQTINSAQGKPGNGGRIDALQDLAGDDVVLDGVNLAGADLTRVRLPRASLRSASLGTLNGKPTVLLYADLEGAILMEAHLEGANLMFAHLEGANLLGAHLEGANLRCARLEGAILMEAHLEGANLKRARLEGASLWGAHLEGAELVDAHLEGAKLVGANLLGVEYDHRTRVEHANIWGIKNAPDGFRDWALEHGAIEIDPAVEIATDDQPPTNDSESPSAGV